MTSGERLTYLGKPREQWSDRDFLHVYANDMRRAFDLYLVDWMAAHSESGKSASELIKIFLIDLDEVVKSRSFMQVLWDFIDEKNAPTVFELLDTNSESLNNLHIACLTFLEQYLKTNAAPEQPIGHLTAQATSFLFGVLDLEAAKNEIALNIKK